MKFLEPVRMFLALMLLGVVIGVTMHVLSPKPRPARATEPHAGPCCQDCKDVKRFVDAVCDEAGSLPPVRSICNKYNSN